MMSVKIEEESNTMDVSHLASGMYIVRIGGKTDKLDCKGCNTTGKSTDIAMRLRSFLLHQDKHLL